jgi:hypothetical protein
MALLIGIFAALFVVFLLGYITVRKPAFGRVLIVLCSFLILFAVFFYSQKDERKEAKKQRIPVDQIELSEINYGLSYGNYYKLTAIIKNLSTQYRLQAVILNISFFQCQELEKKVKDTMKYNVDKCRLLETKSHRVATRLEAEMVENIETYLPLDDALQLNNIVWQVEIASGIAR